MSGGSNCHVATLFDGGSAHGHEVDATLHQRRSGCGGDLQRTLGIAVHDKRLRPDRDPRPVDGLDDTLGRHRQCSGGGDRRVGHRERRALSAGMEQP